MATTQLSITRRQTRRTIALNRNINWNTAIAEGRVMRSQGGLSFASFATRADALDAVYRVQLAGMEANIVDPSLADDSYAAKAVR